MARIEHRVVRDVVSLDGSATCEDAVRLMRARGIGSVGVRRGRRLVGLVTRSDLESAASGPRGGLTPLAEAVRADLPTVSSRASETECAHLMRTRRTRHLAVTEGGELVGLISMRDLAELVAEDERWSVDELERYLRGRRARELGQPVRAAFLPARAALR